MKPEYVRCLNCAAYNPTYSLCIRNPPQLDKDGYGRFPKVGGSDGCFCGIKKSEVE